MSKKLSLTLACGDYDRMQAIKDGKVVPEGIDLNFIPFPRVAEVFWRMIRHEEFDVSEMSLSSYIIMRSSGDYRFMALPVFTSRIFRHSCIFVNASSGIHSPEDLKGKRVGIPEYEMTAGVWVRGLLREEYNVKPEEFTWYTGGQEETGREEKIRFEVPKGVNIVHVTDNTLSAMLKEGELDALIVARLPSCFNPDTPQVRRLFPDYKEQEKSYFKRTNIFPIMHTVVIKEKLYQENPWAAKSLFKMFEEAKQHVYKQQYDTSALNYTVPWLVSEIEETRALMGIDFWPYGFHANEKTLETLIGYLREQGMLKNNISASALFPKETLDNYRI